MKTKCIFGLLICALIALSCVQRAETDKAMAQQKYIRITATATGEYTRTQINGPTLSWTKGDQFGLFFGNIQNNVCMYNGFTSYLSDFEGNIEKKGGEPVQVKCYAYYPFLKGIEGNQISAVLPQEQGAPFDATANFMTADEVEVLYDEDNLPALSLNFNNQLMGLMKLSVTNSSATIQNEKIQRIDVFSTEGKTMSGDFNFDITDPMGTFAFSDISVKKSSVTSVFSKSEGVGTGKTIETYLFVRPSTFNGLKVLVQTDKHTYSYIADGTVSFPQGEVVCLPVLDLAEGHSSDILGIACWGDSYTHGNYAYAPILQNILGGGWKVYDGGISGNRTIEIAARQGGIKSYVRSSFTFPATATGAGISGIVLEDSELTVDKDRPFRENWGATTSLLNPCVISGVECTLTNSSVTRLAPGDSQQVAAGAEISTFGNRISKEVDVTVIYMGANGGFNNDYDLLVKQHWAMIKNTATKKYIVMSYHNRVIPGYIDLFNSAFGTNAADFCPEAYDGQNHVIHLRNAVHERATELLLKTGVYRSASEISDEDSKRIAKGDWPLSFCTSASDSHPNTAGETAIAFLIHDKMVKLGYLDDSYILDDVTSL